MDDTLVLVPNEPPYPYPSSANVANFVSVKLLGKQNYFLWKTQFLCLLESLDMLGFLDGRFPNPRDGKMNVRMNTSETSNYFYWRRSDALIRGWILGTLNEDVLADVLAANAAGLQTSKDVWIKLHATYVSDIQKPAESGETSISFWPAMFDTTDIIDTPVPSAVLPLPPPPPPRKPDTTKPGTILITTRKEHNYGFPIFSHRKNCGGVIKIM